MIRKIFLSLFIILWIVLFIFLTPIVSTVSGINLKSSTVDLDLKGDQVHYFFNDLYVTESLIPEVVVRGWAFVETTLDNPDKSVKIVFSSPEKAYEIDMDLWDREDLEYEFEDITIPENRNGFYARFSHLGMDNGLYYLYVYVYENEQDYGIVDTNRIFRKEHRSFYELEPADAKAEPSLKYYIDQIDVRRESVFIKGWTFVEGMDTEDNHVFIEVTAPDGGQSFYKTNKYNRKDVGAAHENELYNRSGFKTSIPFSAFEYGDNALAVIIDHAYRAKEEFVFSFLEKTESIKFDFDVLDIRQDSVFIEGWASFEQLAITEAEISLEVSDQDGNAVLYRTKTIPSNTEGAELEGESVITKGFRTSIPITDFKYGENTLAIVIDGQYRSEQEFVYPYLEKTERLLFEIETIDINIQKSIVWIEGWAILEGADMDGKEISIEIKTPEGDLTINNTRKVERPDIATAFGNEQYRMSGFRASIPLSAFGYGGNQLAIAVDEAYRSQDVLLCDVIEENKQISFNIDEIKIKKVKQSVFIEGWALLEGSDMELHQITIEIAKPDGSVALYGTTKVERMDIVKEFNDDQYLQSGFRASIPLTAFGNGENRLSIVIDKQIFRSEDEFLYYVYHSQDGFLYDFVDEIKSISFNIEEISIHKVKQNVFIEGWAFLEGSDMENHRITVEITRPDGSIEIYSTLKIERKDIVGEFENEQYLMSGFRTSVPLSAFGQGENEIAIIIDNQYRSEEVYTYHYEKK